MPASGELSIAFQIGRPLRLRPRRRDQMTGIDIKEKQDDPAADPRCRRPPGPTKKRIIHIIRTTTRTTRRYAKSSASVDSGSITYATDACTIIRKPSACSTPSGQPYRDSLRTLTSLPTDARSMNLRKSYYLLSSAAVTQRGLSPPCRLRSCGPFHPAPASIRFSSFTKPGGASCQPTSRHPAAGRTALQSRRTGTGVRTTAHLTSDSTSSCTAGMAACGTRLQYLYCWSTTPTTISCEEAARRGETVPRPRPARGGVRPARARRNRRKDLLARRPVAVGDAKRVTDALPTDGTKHICLMG